MAINMSTNPAFTGRHTAADTDYPYGSSQDETSSGANDGTPYLKVRSDDLFGFQQALLQASNIVPSGTADTSVLSQYMQGLIEQVLGRAKNVVNQSSVANTYIMSAATNNHPAVSLFEGLTVEFVVPVTNTGASTLNVYGLGAINITGSGSAGSLVEKTRVTMRYNSTSNEFERTDIGAASGIPTGTILSYAAETAPAGYLYCDGSNVSRTTYATLFSLIGTTFGDGDGSSTFSLPDLRGRFVRGWPQSDTGSPDAGRAFGSSQDHALQQHTHTVRTPVNVGDSDRGSTRSLWSIDAQTNAATSGAAGANTASETRPVNLSLAYIIRV